MRIGIDLGGTKIEALALGADGRELGRIRVATPRDQYAETLQTIARLVHTLETELGEQGTVGVGIPGTIMRPSGLVKNANSTWINGQPLERDLSAVLAREVRCENDANCLALSEATDGSGAGCRMVFAVILGTGAGGVLPLQGESTRAGTVWPANGAITVSPGRAATKFRGRRAIAESPGASKPGFQAQLWARITSADREATFGKGCCGSRRARRSAGRGPPSRDSRIESREDLRRWSTSSIPM